MAKYRMTKKVKNENANVTKERLAKGQEFLLSFPSAESLFEELKQIVREHIPNDSPHYLDCCSYLDYCSYYRLFIGDKKLREISFNFGGNLTGYEITLDASFLKIRSKNKGKWVYSNYTCDLIKD